MYGFLSVELEIIESQIISEEKFELFLSTRYPRKTITQLCISIAKL